jgi:hypothetical protein
MAGNYWLDLFTYETWKEFLAAGAKISGFSENRFKTAQNIKPGDIFLCYLTGISRWIGLLEVSGPVFKDNSKIWSRAQFPVRLPVRLIEKLDPETAVPVLDMRESLSFFHNLKSPHAWTGRFRGSPTKWSIKDGEAVVAAIRAAAKNPVTKVFDPAKLAKVPPILKTAKGDSVVIPGSDSQSNSTDAEQQSEIHTTDAAVGEATAHTEIQWRLLKFGNDMGLDVWVAKNDKGRKYNGQPFALLPRIKSTLPLQFDEATNRTIELIDVLWLKNNSIQAAFEIESTTSIFSGLLRLADLITMQPNLNIPLFVVAPSERRNKVFSEVNRPTFARLSQPMSEICRFISFEELRKELDRAQHLAQFLKPEFLDSISEDCVIPD